MKFFKSFIYTLLFTAILSTTSFAAIAANPDPDPEKTPIDLSQLDAYATSVDAELQVNGLLVYAHQFRGVPYRRGAMSPRAFDCSGFTSYVFKEFGYKLNRCASAQINNGKRVNRTELQRGDLVFFGGRGNGRGIGHVGIVTKVDENGDGFSFIHASCHNGITVSHSSESYYRARYRAACRVLK